MTDREILQAIQKLLDRGAAAEEIAWLLTLNGYPVQGYHLLYHFERKVQ